MADESGWLIEFLDRENGNVQYLGRTVAGFGRTEESLDAIRFSRESDARDVMTITELSGAAAVEHLWVENEAIGVQECGSAEITSRLKCELLLKEAELQLPENQRILEIQRLEAELRAYASKMAANDQRLEVSMNQVDRLQAELQRFRTMSTVEIICENESVRAHVTEWENRCLKAEAELQEARQRHAEYVKSQSTIALDYQGMADRLQEARQQLANVKGWQKCSIHGQINADHAWGCPDCVRQLRSDLTASEERLQIAVAVLERVLHFVPDSIYYPGNQVNHAIREALDQIKVKSSNR